jgi:hypothetical protein
MAKSEFDTMAIVRPRHTAPFLGRTGWQIAECRLPLNIELISTSEFELLLQPEVVHHLEVASNYELCFFNSNLQRIDSVIVRWSGVSYRAPRGEISPIEIVKPADIPSDGFNVGNNIKGKDVDILFKNVEQSDSSSLKGFDPAWTGNPNSLDTVDLPKSPEKPDDFLVLQVPSPLSKTPDHIPIGSYDRKVVRRISCRNPVCGAKILNSMKICPFCMTSV